MMQQYLVMMINSIRSQMVKIIFAYLQNYNKVRGIKNFGIQFMTSFKSAAKTLAKKLQLNPVSLGGNTIYATPLGMILGGLVMIVVGIYAVGKFSYINDSRNVVSNAFYYENDPYQVNLSEWGFSMSIYETRSKQYVNYDNMLELGLNITAWNQYGQGLQKTNPSTLINSQTPNRLTIDNTKTPFIVSGSNYVHESPPIKQYLVELQYCEKELDPRCSDNENRIYSITLFLNPKWVYLENPHEPGIREMKFNQKVVVDRSKPTNKYQYTYDIYGFNVTSDTSLFPAFFPRTLSQEEGSSMAGPATKIYLPQDSKSIVEFHFRRSQRSESYTRKYNSIDAIFAEILGIIALFSLILWVLFAHYTSWSSEQFILKSVQPNNRRIHLFSYLGFYLRCKKYTTKQLKILQEVHQNIIESYKQRKRRKVEIEILKLRLEKIESRLKMESNESECKEIILEKLLDDQRNQMFSSSILTEEIRVSLLSGAK